MASRATKPLTGEANLIPDGAELDRLIKAKVAKADANSAPGIPMTEVFDGLRKRHAERAVRGA